MSNSNHMFGANNGRSTSGFQPMTPTPQNAGLNPRYVPPQRREREMYENDAPIRPESSMSHASFASQLSGVGGGVSLNDLMDGVSIGPANTYGGSADGGSHARQSMYGTNRGFVGNTAGQHGLGSFGAGGAGQSVFASGHSPGSGRFSQITAAQSWRSSGQGVGNQDQYGGGFGAVGSPAHGMGGFHQAQYKDPRYDQGHRSSYGQPGNGSGEFGVSMSRQLSESTVADSARGGTNKAVHLAKLIKSGATESAGDPGPDGGHGRRGRHQPLQTLPLPPQVYTNTKAVIGTSSSNSGRARDIKGNAVAFLGVNVVALPGWFANLQFGFKPSVEAFFDILPVIEPCRSVAPSAAGVVRIKELPYTANRSEVTAFVGRNAQVILQPQGSPFYATHIMMNCNDGKTEDGFIEFNSPVEASWVIKQFEKRILTGRLPKIGDRPVEVELCTQADLMHNLFRKAKNLKWNGNTPCIEPEPARYYPDSMSTGFDGFLQKEEIFMVTKHAETPHRSAFVERKIVRVYEFWISILHKYPWHVHEYVLLTERQAMFEATVSLVKCLIYNLNKADSSKRGDPSSKPTKTTLQELTVAALVCPGFTEAMKAYICKILSDGGYSAMTTGQGMTLTYGGTHPLAPAWPFQVLARAPNAPYELVQYFAHLIQEATVGGLQQQLSLAELHTMRASGANRGGPFGIVSIDYGNAKTLAEAGQIELRVVEALLRKVLPSERAHSSSSRTASSS